MASKRQLQVAETIKRNFSLVLQSEGNYIYGSPLVTVTNVVMSPDLMLAKIYLSVFKSDNKQGVILMLEENNTRLRQSLAQRIKNQVRRVPEIDFYLDDTLDESYRLDALFKRLREENEMGEEE
ncbi:MAG: 30S ribosome-binding factor RbfA [Saprospiraceae bacterium]|nr:30S ribosome-binding factor RbfA [Saprospiraceae bacterium]